MLYIVIIIIREWLENEFVNGNILYVSVCACVCVCVCVGVSLCVYGYTATMALFARFIIYLQMKISQFQVTGEIIFTYIQNYRGWLQDEGSCHVTCKGI